MKQEYGSGLLVIIISLILLRFPGLLWRVAEAWKNSDKTTPSNVILLYLDGPG